jgi:hypothetical protein
METHAAVLVHERDRARALPVAVAFNKELETVSEAGSPRRWSPTMRSPGRRSTPALRQRSESSVSENS